MMQMLAARLTAKDIFIRSDALDKARDVLGRAVLQLPVEIHQLAVAGLQLL